MQIILLHGLGEVGKRNFAHKFKKQFSSDITQVDLKQESVSNLEMKITSPSLFNTSERLLVVENVPDALDLQQLKKGDNNLTILLLAEDPKTQSPLLSSAKKLNAKIYLFEGEKELNAFPFLDALIEQKKQAFVELEKLLAEYSSMYIFTMIYYLLRRNFFPAKSGFMQEKILRQKKKYQPVDFGRLYYLTLETEFRIKRGSVDEKTGLMLLVQKIISWGQY